VHANLGKLPFQIFFLHSTTHIHSNPNPSNSLLLSEPLKTFRLLFPETDHQKTHLHPFAMKFKTNSSVASKKNTADHQKTESSAPKMVEPLTTVPPMKRKKKTASKSTYQKKKKTVKEGE